jgi:hypothetical protein
MHDLPLASSACKQCIGCLKDFFKTFIGSKALQAFEFACCESVSNVLRIERENTRDSGGGLTVITK